MEGIKRFSIRIRIAFLLILVAAGAIATAATLASTTSPIEGVALREARTDALSTLGAPCHVGSMQLPGYRQVTYGVWKEGGSFVEVVFAAGWTTGNGIWESPGRSEVVARLVSWGSLRDSLRSCTHHVAALDFSVWRPLSLISPHNGEAYCYSQLPDANVVGYVCGHKPRSAPLPARKD